MAHAKSGKNADSDSRRSARKSGTEVPFGVTTDAEESWADRAADRSPTVQRSRTRSVRHAKVIVDAARRLIEVKGIAFTTRELAGEAGVALQTFYRHFAGKDELLLAVFEDFIVEQVELRAVSARELPDPVARLHFHITSSLDSLRDSSDVQGAAWAKFITAEHWRLHQLFPGEMARIDMSFADLVEKELREATSLGLLRSTRPRQDAWFVMKLVMSVFHDFAFAIPQSNVGDISAQLWDFCLAAFGGAPGERSAKPK